MTNLYKHLPAVKFVCVPDTDDTSGELVVLIDDESFLFNTVLHEKVVCVKLINKEHYTKQ